MNGHHNRVVPAVIPQSFDHLRDTLMSLESVVTEVQVDIVDGRFVPFTSWPYRGSGSVMLLQEFATTFSLEVDLMIENPEHALPLYASAGVRSVVIHLESVTDMARVRALQKEHSFTLGLSIRNDTPLTALTNELRDGDYVQLMGISDIGSQGQPFDERVLTRIAELRRAHPALTISIDGSVNRETLPRLKDAGADRFVSGSAILGQADPIAAYRALTLL